MHWKGNNDFFTFILNNGLKKRKNSLEGSLDQVLFAAEHVFPKILIPKLQQNASNVYAECAGEQKHRYSLCDQPYRAPICLSYCFDIVFSIDFPPSEQRNI